MLELFGVPADQLIGRSVQSTIPDFPIQLEVFPAGFRLNAIRSNGVTFPIQVSVSEYPTESQVVRIAILRDLTWSEQAEKEKLERMRETEALRTQQMTTLAQIATGVAHEIRNPLTSIKMLIQVNLASLAKTGLPTEDLELVEHEIRRMERSVNSLLEYARPEKPEFAEFSIQDVLRRTVLLIAGHCESQNVSLCVKSPETPILLYGDAAQIQQLLLNLTLNALDAMHAGGTLNLQSVEAGANVEISVRDSGAGIPSGMLDKLFTPFTTTKPNGVGLGLGICRRIAEAHRGSLSGRNHSEGGAEFLLTLPMAAKANAPSSRSTNAPSSANTTEVVCKVS